MTSQHVPISLRPTSPYLHTGSDQIMEVPEAWEQGCDGCVACLYMQVQFLCEKFSSLDIKVNGGLSPSIYH